MSDGDFVFVMSVVGAMGLFAVTLFSVVLFTNAPARNSKRR